jgi:hypothetical protein
MGNDIEKFDEFFLFASPVNEENVLTKMQLAFAAVATRQGMIFPLMEQ